MDYVRYLQAKETVDDRALNATVLQTFETRVQQHGQGREQATLRIVELGCGVGSMFLRLFKRGRLFENYACVQYTMVDVKYDVLLMAEQRIVTEMRRLKQCVSTVGAVGTGQGIESKLRKPQVGGVETVHHVGETGDTLKELCVVECGDKVEVTLMLGDALRFLERRKNMFDVVIGAAVLDLWPMEYALRTVFEALDTGSGLATFYFPINFDGTTDFFPEFVGGSEVDKRVEDAFHRSMGTRIVLGCQMRTCYTGRRLVPCLAHLGAEIDSVGASSWIVMPSAKGQYEADEKFFLTCIVEFIEATVKEFPGEQLEADAQALAEYLSDRRRQISQGELFYVAHNMDVCGHI